VSDDQRPRQDHEGEVVVITGGSRGLGRAMALAFAQRGATVVVASRKLDACRELAEHLTATTGRPALGVACHVGRWSDCDRLVESAYEAFGTVDVLINNAGMSPLYPSLSEVTEELFDKVIAVNLKGAFRLSAAIGARMAQRGSGAIVNISSVAAVQPAPGDVPYAIAKAGLNALTGGLARAYGPSVRVNAIMAGPFATDVTRAWDMENFQERVRTSIPLQRVGQPDEIVGAALYLAGPAATYTTGAILKVDGGYAHSAG
jgi:NAD(P)-dependent dehydrogenase (short-subunit alcohol dehydrogenase family)